MSVVDIITQIETEIKAKVQSLVIGETNKIVINAPVRGGGYHHITQNALDNDGIKHITFRTTALFEGDCIGEGEARFAEFQHFALENGLSSSDAIIFDIELGIDIIPTMKAFEAKWLADGGRIIHIVR